jgi:hypothetical protein
MVSTYHPAQPAVTMVKDNKYVALTEEDSNKLLSES